ncbi:hypothetical protein [Saccharopolyspora sp. CA-218241]|uniref:aromatic-ring hydroxylase C-terminal domain-containing protein n=1 Tax=Saccharopolyspora sp. CA-218241 TaxID=3240027 RepID=UPI003D969B46
MDPFRSPGPERSIRLVRLKILYCQHTTLLTTYQAAPAATPGQKPNAALYTAPWADAEDPPADAILVRPDGYVAWAGSDPGELTRALRTWFGEPADAG